MWYWYLLIVLLAILLLWWALTRQAKFTETPSHGHADHGESHAEVIHVEEQASHIEEPVIETKVDTISTTPGVPDDLVIIEGIGPKIASVLAAAGITTFSALASTDPEKIKAILTASDPRLGRISDPTSWPQQARLAADGDTVGLQKLQDSLKGGRQS